MSSKYKVQTAQIEDVLDFEKGAQLEHLVETINHE